MFWLFTLPILLTVQFTDIAATAGLDFQHVSGTPEKKYILESFSGGIAWIDYNRDGHPDLYVVNGGRWEDLTSGTRSVSNALFRNDGDGTFTEVTEEAGVAGSHWGMGIAVGDFDNDGWSDFYLCNYGPNTLYRNNGDGSFTDVTKKAGVGDARWSSSAAFGDYDSDGYLDLYVANYLQFDHTDPPAPDCQYRGIQVQCGPKGMTAVSDVLYRNNGDGTFSDVTQASGMAGVLPSYGLGALWGDFDNDGDSDLYVANDSMANFLFENLGKGSFREVGLLAGVALSQDGKAQAGMGVAAGDFDRNGLLDIFVTHFSEDYNTLYQNQGNGLFRDISYSAGLAFSSWRYLGWGTAFFDFDNDGWQDLLVANGHVYPEVDDYLIDADYAQGKQIFRNLGNCAFEEVSAKLGPALALPQASRGAAFSDFDNDGDVDVAVNNIDGRPSLFRNDGGNRSGNWLSLKLEGTVSNSSAIGARVILETASGKQLQEVQGGSSYQSTNDLRLHYGLGGETRIERLQIRWPSGKLQVLEGLAPNRLYRIREGEPAQEVVQ